MAVRALKKNLRFAGLLAFLTFVLLYWYPAYWLQWGSIGVYSTEIPSWYRLLRDLALLMFVAFIGVDVVASDANSVKHLIKKSKLDPLFILYAGTFLGISALQIISGADFRETLIGVRAHLLYFSIVFLMPFISCGPLEMRRYIAFILLAGVALNLGAFYQIFLGPPGPHDYGQFIKRAVSSLGDPTTLALFLNYTVFICLSFSLVAKRTWLTTLLPLISIVSLVFTVSLTGFISLILGVFLLLFMFRRIAILVVWGLVAILAAFLVGSTSLVKISLLEKIQAYALGTHGGLETRISMIQNVGDYIQRTSLADLFLGSYPQKITSETYLLNLLMSKGLIVTLLFLGVVIHFIAKGYKNIQRAEGEAKVLLSANTVFLAIFVLGTGGLPLFEMFPAYFFFWFICALNERVADGLTPANDVQMRLMK